MHFIIVSGAAALRGSRQDELYEYIKNIEPKEDYTYVGKLASLVARQLSHWYMNGMAYGKHLVALAIGNIFMCSDRELPDELKEGWLFATASSA